MKTTLDSIKAEEEFVYLLQSTYASFETIESLPFECCLWVIIKCLESIELTPNYLTIKELIETFAVDENGKVIYRIFETNKNGVKGGLKRSKTGSALLGAEFEDSNDKIRKRSKSPISRIIKSRTFSGLRNLGGNDGSSNSATASPDVLRKNSKPFWNFFRSRTPSRLSKKVKFEVEEETEIDIPEIVFEKEVQQFPEVKILTQQKLHRRYSFHGLTQNMKKILKFKTFPINSNDETLINGIENFKTDTSFSKYFCIKSNKHDLFRSTFCLLTSKFKRSSSTPSTPRITNAITNNDSSSSSNNDCKSSGGGGNNIHLKTADCEILNKLNEKYLKITPGFSVIHRSTSATSFSTSFKEFHRKILPIFDVFFGEGMSIVLEAEKAADTIAKNAENSKVIQNEKILALREAVASSNEKINKKLKEISTQSEQQQQTSNKLTASEFFVQITQKLEARPKIQKLGEKLKTLIAPREQQHFVHFRRLFDSYIPEGDNLIMTFPCSYKSKFKDFPLHGRMYLTLSMIGFSSSLFGYEKKIIISLRDVISLKKDRSSKFSINSIKIVTQSGEKHSFGSLKSRDKIYSLLFRVLRMNVDPDKRDSMIEDEEELDQLNTGGDQKARDCRIDSHQMTASDTSSEGSDEQSYTSTGSNPSQWPESATSIIPIECPCHEHKGKKLLDIEIPLNVQQTFQLLFTDNEWINKLESEFKRSGKKCTSWKEEENVKKERICIYTVELDNTFGPKSTKITETQTCNPIISYNNGYILNKEAINEGIPYADSFNVECIYCVTKVSETKSRLKVHGGITFKKYIFGLIKSVIERSTVNGLDAYYTSLVQKLKSDEEELLTFITEMESDEPSNAEDALIDDRPIIPNTHSTLGPAIAINPFADRVISLSNLKEATEFLPTSVPSSSNSVSTQSEIKTVVLLLKIIAILLFLIFLSNVYFNFSTNRSSSSPHQTISSGPSQSSMEELSELRKLVTSLETKFNSFITGAKKEL